MKLVLAIVFSAFLFAPDASSWAADLGDMTVLRKQPLDDEVLGASRKVPSVSLDGGEMTAGRLRVEYLETPQGIDAAQPRLSWELRDTRRAARQTAYRIPVASDAGRLATDDGDLWDSGKVASTETLGIEYAGTPLTSRQRCFWKVQVWDADDRVSAWVGSGQYAFRAAKSPSPPAAADPGFVRIAEHGVGLTLKGRPYRAIGVNIPHLPQAWMGTWFHRNQFYASPEAMRQAMVEAIEDAARHGVAFIRFFGSPGYPKETAELYHKDKAAYWRQMDELFARCRKQELKLVPSLGVLSKWHQEFGEPRSAVFDPKSKTHAATYGYVREFVTRYRDDPTVLMWELENEGFLKADGRKPTTTSPQAPNNRC